MTTIAVIADGLCLRFAPIHFRGMESVVRHAMNQNIRALEFAMGDLRSKVTFMHEAVNINPLALEFAQGAARLDYNITANSVTVDGNALKFADDIFKDNVNIVTLAMGTYSTAWIHASVRVIKILVSWNLIVGQ